MVCACVEMRERDLLHKIWIFSKAVFALRIAIDLFIRLRGSSANYIIPTELFERCRCRPVVVLSNLIEIINEKVVSRNVQFWIHLNTQIANRFKVEKCQWTRSLCSLAAITEALWKFVFSIDGEFIVCLCVHLIPQLSPWDGSNVIKTLEKAMHW